MIMTETFTSYWWTADAQGMGGGYSVHAHQPSASSRVQRHALWAAPSKSLHFGCCRTKTHLWYSCWPLGWKKQRTYKQTSVRNTLASMLNIKPLMRQRWMRESGVCPLHCNKEVKHLCCPCSPWMSSSQRLKRVEAVKYLLKNLQTWIRDWLMHIN